jgi:hypothetical protein
MGEIDRVKPITPVIGPRATERVQPGHDRRQQHHEQKHDELELSNTVQTEDPEPAIEPEQEHVLDPHGLDLSI